MGNEDFLNNVCNILKVKKMSSNESQFNETIQTMVNRYTQKEERVFHFDTPVKRPLSDAGDDGSNVPLKKLKQENDLFYMGSPREIRRLRADLVESRTTIKELKSQITQMHAVQKEMRIMFEHENKVTNAQLDSNQKTIEELENQLQNIRKREQDLKNEFIELKHKYNEARDDRDLQVQELESQMENMKEENLNQSFTESSTISCLTKKVEELESLYKAAKEETLAHKKYVEELTKKLTEQTNLSNELELKKLDLMKAHQQIKKLEFTKETYIEYQQQAKTQQHKLSTYDTLMKENQKLEEENRKLKEAVRYKLVLEEEVYDLKGRLVNYKEQEKKLNQLQVNYAQAEMYLEDFRSLARTVCETTSNDASLPRLLRSVVEKLQQQEIALTTEKIHLDSKLSTANHEAQVAKNELEKSQSHIRDLQNNIKYQKVLVQRLQRKMQLVTGERDSYRKQLDSYEKDLTICYNPASNANPGANQIQSQHERIVNLEKIVENYRELVNKLENDLKNSEAHMNPDAVPIKADQLNRLQDELCKMKNENSLLRERKDRLEIQLEEILVGQDNVGGARIVHNAKNPLAECLKLREEEKERLEVEVASLKRKIKKLEDGLEATKLGDVTIDVKQVQELRAQLTSSEQKYEHLKNVVKDTIQEFRNITYLLFGYKLDKSGSSIWKIGSMYAEGKDDQLCFELHNDGTINLLENEYSANLEEMVDLHLRHQRSVPVFLSTLTIDLFNNKTMTKTYDIEDVEDDDEDEEDEEEEEVEEGDSESS